MSASGSPAPPFTCRLLRVKNADAGSVTIPSGFRAVVRHIDITIGELSTTAVAIYIETTQIYRVNFLPIVSSPYAFWDGYAVAYPNETISFTTDLTAADVQISGYLFEDEGGPAPGF